MPERRFFADWRERNWGEITTQDYENIAGEQQGMHSRGFMGLRLNPKQEGNILHMHRVIDRYLARRRRPRHSPTRVCSASASEEALRRRPLRHARGRTERCLGAVPLAEVREPPVDEPHVERPGGRVDRELRDGRLDLDVRDERRGQRGAVLHLDRAHEAAHRRERAVVVELAIGVAAGRAPPRVAGERDDPAARQPVAAVRAPVDERLARPQIVDDELRAEEAQAREVTLGRRA